MSPTSAGQLDRNTPIADLGIVVHNLLRRGIGMFAMLLVAATLYLFLKDNAHWPGLLWMGGGTLIAFRVWQGKGIGLPLLPLLAIQHFVTYGTPILGNNETLDIYPAGLITRAGIEVCVFLITLAAAWRLGMEFFHPRTARAHVLKAFSTNSSQTRIRAGLILVLVTTSYNLLDSMQLIWPILNMLPRGSYSLISAGVKTTSMAGYFLLGMLVGSHEATARAKSVFWITFAFNALVMASGFLLSSVTSMVAAAIVGLFWGSGRMPWKFLAIMAACLSFLHLGKFDMRERYWVDAEEEAQAATFASMPGRYAEWAEASYRNLIGSDSTKNALAPDKDQDSMLDRVNNLQNLLFAINAVDIKKIPTLDGSTYTLIPSLLIPRVFWPGKPRAHEGQVQLNVHFGRQSLDATFKTYIAWGLLPEAYGNFGRFWGAILLGAALGIICAWLENATARKPLLSLEGLVSLSVFLGLAVSFEMVSSVLVTSLFQSVIITTIACAPFVQRAFVTRPEEELASDNQTGNPSA